MKKETEAETFCKDRLDRRMKFISFKYLGGFCSKRFRTTIVTGISFVMRDNTRLLVVTFIPPIVCTIPAHCVNIIFFYQLTSLLLLSMIISITRAYTTLSQEKDINDRMMVTVMGMLLLSS